MAKIPPQNEPLSALTHLVGAVLSVVALGLLVGFAALERKPWHLAGFAIFGASLVLLYTASTLYHWFPLRSRWKPLLRRLDHAMIYVLIAGTYTPVCLIPLRGVWGWSLGGVIWALALIGVVVKALWLKLPGWLSTTIYLAMGWLAAVATPALLNSLSGGALGWMLAGGLFYSVGVVFFVLGKLRPRRHRFGMHEVFHLFVMAGSFSHFWLMWRYVLPLP